MAKSHFQDLVKVFVKQVSNDFHSSGVDYNDTISVNSVTTEDIKQSLKILGSQSAQPPFPVEYSHIVKNNINGTSLVKRKVTREVNRPVDSSHASPFHPTSNLTLHTAHNRTISPTKHLSSHLTIHPAHALTVAPNLLSKNAYSVLMFLCKKTTDYYRIKDIAHSCNLPFDTVKSIIQTLKRYNYIISTSHIRKASFQGIRVVLNEQIYDVDPALHSATHPAHDPSVHLTSSFTYSSSLNNKLTTKPREYITDYLSVDNSPEMGFWQIEPNVVNQKQFQAWLEEFNLGPEVLITYLDRCRFEMVELGKEEKLDKGSAVNWFYGVMKKRGGSYPEPSGYKSLLELKIEEEKKIIKKREDQFAEKEELKLKKEFYEILENPDCELYQACFNSLGQFEKGLGKDSKAFRESMYLLFTGVKSQQKAYCKILPVSTKPQG